MKRSCWKWTRASHVVLEQQVQDPRPAYIVLHIATVVSSHLSRGKVLATEDSRLLLATVLRIHRLIVQTVKLPLFFLLCHQIF